MIVAFSTHVGPTFYIGDSPLAMSLEYSLKHLPKDGKTKTRRIRARLKKALAKERKYHADGIDSMFKSFADSLNRL